MKRVFFCGIASALIAACTTAQTEQATKDVGAITNGLAALAPVIGAFAPLEASAPVNASAPAVAPAPASGAAK